MSGRNDEQLLTMKSSRNGDAEFGQLVDEVIWLREHHRKHHHRQRAMRKAGDALLDCFMSTGAACSEEGMELAEAWNESGKLK